DGLVNRIDTEDGADLTFAKNDDTANEASIIGENQTVSDDTDLAFEQVTLRAYTYKAGFIKVAFQLLQDSAIDIGGYIGGKLSERLGRRWARDFAVGTGVNQPEGLVTGVQNGKSFTGATAITYGELVDLEHSVDPAYRDPDRCRHMFNDST